MMAEVVENRRPVTILDLAVYRRRQLGLPEAPDGRITGGMFDEASLDILGGCGICSATVGAYNACPSKSGFWKCANGCIDGDGWLSVEECDRDLFEAVA